LTDFEAPFRGKSISTRGGSARGQNKDEFDQEDYRDSTPLDSQEGEGDGVVHRSIEDLQWYESDSQEDFDENQKDAQASNQKSRESEDDGQISNEHSIEQSEGKQSSARISVSSSLDSYKDVKVENGFKKQSRTYIPAGTTAQKLGKNTGIPQKKAKKKLLTNLHSNPTNCQH
jgi:hypothetical protein